MKIKSIHAREILDSRGNPTIETDVILEDGTPGRASVPSGASTGAHEAHELRDIDLKRFNGLGVLRAVENVNNEIANALIGMEADNQSAIDEKLIALDGTENKERLGANAILSVSLAVAHAVAHYKKLPLFAYIQTLSDIKRDFILPLPLCNVINGGAHAENSTDIQEFMIAPVGFTSFHEALRASSEVFHCLKKALSDRGYATTVGDEGGYAPNLKNGNAEALDCISEAVTSAGYELKKDFVLALDVASSEFFHDGKYTLKQEGKVFSSDEMIDWVSDLREKYEIASIEDGLSEDDWAGWTKLTESLGSTTQLVGDDLLVTNTKFLERAIREKSGNAILIKMNQIGTLTETIRAIRMAQEVGWNTIISHRSGETDDTTIAHLSVGLGVLEIKTGSLSRGERTAKYNELLRIEEALGNNARFAGGSAFTK
ncbi:MAG: phosphopyruvate hydratase [Candidatus Jorgensenbacteria bacterium]|nr:phosphopyruvate hydratase [Candidatus Jorgensenbacteria bacterium]